MYVTELTGFRPFKDNFDLVRSHLEAILSKNESKEFEFGLVKFTFVFMGIKSMSPELSEYSISPNEGLPDITHFEEIIQQNLSTSTLTTSFIPNYLPPPAHEFTPVELDSSLHQTTRKGKANKIVHHPMRAIVEYPESGISPDEAVAYIFPIDPQGFTHPKYNMQYSLSTHGACPKTLAVPLFKITALKTMFCATSTRAAVSFVISSQYFPFILFLGGGICHCQFSQASKATNAVLPTCNNSTREVFMKTLGFFCAMKENGCLFNTENSGEVDGYDNYNPEEEEEEDLYEILWDVQSSSKSLERCNGRLLFKRDAFGKAYIE